jgi:hypothetical protein
MEGDENDLFNLTQLETTTDISASQGPSLAVVHPPWLTDMELSIRAWVIPSLCAIGILFNSTSAIVLFHSELQLRKSLIQLFAFLNTFDW